MHRPVRPSWHCDTCATDWPCPGAKTRLLAEHANARTSLILYLGQQMVLAIGDLPDVPACDYLGRFVGWARETSSTREVSRDRATVTR